MKSDSLLHSISNAIVAAVFFFVVILGVAGTGRYPLQEATVTSRTIQEQPTKLHHFSKLESEQGFRDYTVRIYKNDEADDTPPSVLQILRDGKIIRSEVGYRFYFGHNESAKEYDRLVPIGSDITGRGIPNLVVSEWTGGAHCCFIIHVFELGQEFKGVATIDAKHGDMSHFEKGEEGTVFVTHDFTFAYWNTSFSESPAPKLILRYCDGQYRLADNMMRKQAPSKKKLLQSSRAIISDPAWRNNTPPVVLWSTMLDLIYSGNADSAWKLLEMAWPATLSGKAEFLKGFKEQLAESEYWEQIQLLNAGKSACRGNSEAK